MARPVVQIRGHTGVARASPLYCRYNGFLAGQFLSLAFAGCGAPRYGERRRAACSSSCARSTSTSRSRPQPLDRGGVTYAGMLSAIVPRLASTHANWRSSRSSVGC
jgi:hypothetical protein